MTQALTRAQIIAQISPSITIRSSIPVVSRVRRTTLAEARVHCCLRLNTDLQAFLANKPVKNPLIQQQYNSELFYIHAKFGNTILKDWIVYDEDKSPQTYFGDVLKDAVQPVIELLITDIQNGAADTAIKAVMQRNIEMHAPK